MFVSSKHISNQITRVFYLYFMCHQADTKNMCLSVECFFHVHEGFNAIKKLLLMLMIHNNITFNITNIR